MTMTQTEINDRTGFANGELFSSDDEVREYFQRELLCECLDHMDSAIPNQAELDDMAEAVITNHWHMDSDADGHITVGDRATGVH